MNKLADHYSNTHHHHFIKKNATNVDCSALTGKIEKHPKAPKPTVNDKVRITKYKNIFRESIFFVDFNEIFKVNI